MYQYLRPRNGSMPRMRADGRGQRLRQSRERQHFNELRKANNAAVERERARTKVAAPVLNSLLQLEEVCTSGPQSPVYKLAMDGTIRDIGRVVFGDGGYNRVKSQPLKNDIGPHFDAYARHFSPWTIHMNNGGRRMVRATFLPPDIWQEYIESTEGLTQVGVKEQRERFKIGKTLFDSGVELTTGILNDGDLTLLWHGELSDTEAPPPSVHEFSYAGLPNLIATGTGRANRVTTSYDSQSTYSIYARQDEPGDFEGFVAV